MSADPYASMIAGAAAAYHANPNILQGIRTRESGDTVGADPNTWDSNARAGTPSEGPFQFIEPTYKAFSAQAKAADPSAWQGVNDTWLNPQAQALTTAWAITNGHQGDWTTYDAAAAGAHGQPQAPYHAPAASPAPAATVSPAAPTGNPLLTNALTLAGLDPSVAQLLGAGGSSPAPAATPAAPTAPVAGGPAASKVLAAATAQIGDLAPKAEAYAKANGQPFDFNEWCFAAGTLVDTPRGYVPIEHLGVGDEVIAHDGTVHRVSWTMDRESDTVIVKAQGIHGTRVSPDHPYYARRRESTTGSERRFSDPVWVNASDLRKGDLVALCAYSGDVDFYASDAYVMGRYLADGWTSGGNSLICCSHDEADELRKKIRSANIHASESHHRTVRQFRLSLHGRKLVERCGSGAHSKRVPGEVFTWNETARAALLEGYMDGDGCLTNGYFCAGTVSRELAYGIAKLARSLGNFVGVYFYPRASTCVIEGRTVNQSGRYEVQWRQEKPRGRFVHVIEDGPIHWTLVKSATPSGPTTVYNITVDGEHTYIADGIAVHNCGDFVQSSFKAAGLPVPPARSVPGLLSWAKANGKFTTHAAPGDLEINTWDGSTPQHVGIVTANGQELSGNTGGPRGATVAVKPRASNTILGYVNPYG